MWSSAVRTLCGFAVVLSVGGQSLLQVDLLRLGNVWPCDVLISVAVWFVVVLLVWVGLGCAAMYSALL